MNPLWSAAPEGDVVVLVNYNIKLPTNKRNLQMWFNIYAAHISCLSQLQHVQKVATLQAQGSRVTHKYFLDSFFPPKQVFLLLSSWVQPKFLFW